MGKLPRSPPLDKAFPQAYDLMASFGDIFLYEGEAYKITIVGVANINEKILYSTNILDFQLDLEDPELTESKYIYIYI